MEKAENVQTRHRGDGHLIVYVVWPVTGGLLVGIMMAIGVGGLVGLLSRNWVAGGGWMAGTFFVVCPTVTLLTFLYAARGWGGPLRLERARQDAGYESVEVIEPEDERPAMVIRPYMPALPDGLTHQIRSLEPKADHETMALYQYISKMWPLGTVTQTASLQAGFRRKDWDKYVGGSRRKKAVGTESGRGILDRAGVVRKDGGSWVICAPLDKVFKVTPELEQYAAAKAEIVRL